MAVCRVLEFKYCWLNVTVNSSLILYMAHELIMSFSVRGVFKHCTLIELVDQSTFGAEYSMFCTKVLSMKENIIKMLN